MEQIITYFESIDPILAALYATLFTWALTALGASLVFLLKGMNRALLDGNARFYGRRYGSGQLLEPVGAGN